MTQSTPKGAFEGADETTMLVARFELGLHLKAQIGERHQFPPGVGGNRCLSLISTRATPHGSPLTRRQHRVSGAVQ